MTRLHFVVFVTALILATASGTAMAHAPGLMMETGFGAGFAHVIGGLDHVLAALVVGAWLSRLGRSLPLLAGLAAAGFAVFHDLAHDTEMLASPEWTEFALGIGTATLSLMAVGGALARIAFALSRLFRRSRQSP